MQHDTCAVCRKVIKGEVVCCTPCSITAHPSCMKLHRTRSCIAVAGSSKPPVALCGSGDRLSSPVASSACAPSTSPPASSRALLQPPDATLMAIQDLTRSVNTFMAEQREQTEKFNSLFAQLTSITADHAARISSLEAATTTYATQLNEVTTSISDSQASVLSLRNEQAALRQQLHEMRSHVTARLDLAARASEVLISGLPEVAGEDPRGVVRQVALALGVSIGASDILAASRMRGTPGVNRPRTLHARLASPASRDSLLNAKRSKGLLLASAISPAFSSSQARINVNEYLPREISLLLKRCRTLARERGYTRVWHRDGTIFVKKTPSDPPLRVSTDADIASKLS